MLTYLMDDNITNNLIKCLQSENDEFIGMIANVHCSHTPCHSCATSFTRESEEGGIFNRISKGKPVCVVCSCQNHYTRRNDMLPYEKTNFLSVLNETIKDQPLQFSFDSKNLFTSYPVLLMKFEPIDSTWSVDDGHYRTMILRQQ